MGTAANLYPMVVTARLTRFKNRQVSGLDQTGVFPDRAFDGPINGNTVTVEFFKCATADSADDDTVHFAAPQRGHRITGPMLMILIRILEDLRHVGIQVHKNKMGRGTKMIVNHTIHAVVI